ncbi:unnamed protein product [Adineta steineri]|uniref:G-protein coupled receptors family 1 profile domain-containing protein n=1 Tax=Adineta steineri TaxID=433720 RepID=A0A814YHW0_9BILA|nr:unnamed protein product [Adineta steineri]CAF1230579.1 unnamed protein product [Adineta steineri]CAF4059567.1 unnamed protein product [Adineta steineri]CAF4083488.1 unnamed protein product [Adineta steineri]
MASNNTFINELNKAATTQVLVHGIINLVLGAIGLVFNILVFTRPSLHREPCSVYFFWSSCFNLVIVYGILPLRILGNGFNIDFSNRNVVLCKIEYFVNYAGRSVSIWLIVLACVDRFCHSSTNAIIRRMSSLKTARWAAGVVSLIIMLSYSHMPVYYLLTYTLNQFGSIVSTCNAQIGTYRTFLGFWYMALYSLCPCFLMSLFGSLTLRNIRRHRQIVPTVAGRNQLARRTDNQLLRMLIAQVTVIIVATLPNSIYQLYIAFTSNVLKDTLRVAQDNLAGRTVGPIMNFAHTSSFYLYTLTGTIFRKELRKIIQRCCHPTRNMSTSQHESILMTVAPSNRKLVTQVNK